MKAFVRRKKGRRIFILCALATATVVFVTGCNMQEVPSSWNTNNIKIDGRINDWEGASGTFFSDQNASVLILNDQENMYILFRTSDAQWAQTIKMTGLTLYFNGKGKKKKDSYICFKGGPDMKDLMKNKMGGQMPGGMSGGTGTQGDSKRGIMMGGDDRQIMADAPPSLVCYSKEIMSEKAVPLDSRDGLAAAYDTCQGLYTYEVRIPLAESTIMDYGIGAETGAKVAIGALWGSTGEREEKMGGAPPSGMDGGGGGRGGGGKGGGRSGGMGGGPPGGGQGQEMPEEQEVWIKSQLALSPEMQAELDKEKGKDKE